MLRRTRRILTPEETERAQREGAPGSAVAPTKPSLLSRLKLGRKAGEARTTVAPPERYAEVSPPDVATPLLETPRRTRAQPVAESLVPPRRASRAPAPASARKRPLPTDQPAAPVEPERKIDAVTVAANRKKPRRSIQTPEAVHLRYHQEPAVEETTTARSDCPSTFIPWHVPADRRGTEVNDDALQGLIVEIVETEGPILCSRLYDLVAETLGSRPTSRLNQLVHRTVSQRNGPLAQVEPLGGGQQNKTVYPSSTDPRVFRTLGERALQHLPPIELGVHVAHARQALGIPDGEEGDRDLIAAATAKTLEPTAGDTRTAELASMLEWHL